MMEQNKNDFYIVSVEDTIKYGIICAAIIGRVRWWCEYNKKHKNKERFHQKEWWSGFMSAREFAEQIGLSQRTIEKNLSKLIKSGVLIKGKFNKKGFDKTNWYRVNPYTHIEDTIYANRVDDIRLEGTSIYANRVYPYTHKEDTNTCKSSVNQNVNQSGGQSVNPPVNPYKFINYNKLKDEYEFEFKTKLQKEQLTLEELKIYLEEEEIYYKLNKNE